MPRNPLERQSSFENRRTIDFNAKEVKNTTDLTTETVNNYLKGGKLEDNLLKRTIDVLDAKLKDTEKKLHEHKEVAIKDNVEYTTGLSGDALRVLEADRRDYTQAIQWLKGYETTKKLREKTDLWKTFGEQLDKPTKPK